VTRFEYRKIDLNAASAKVSDVDLLNAAGREGWRVVWITANSHAYLEREIIETEPAPKPKRAYTRRTPSTTGGAP
jgi:hypothetical protein